MAEICLPQLNRVEGSWAFLRSLLEITRAVEEYEEAVKMPYVTSVERVGRKKGMQQGMQQGMRQGTIRGMREAVLEVLDTRFGTIPPALVSAINAMEDQPKLKRLLKEAVLTPSPEAFQRLLETGRP